MNREDKIEYLIDQLLAENTGYVSIPKPVDMQEKRRLLRSLMNVRFPGPLAPEVLKLQDELLQEELEEKGVVDVMRLPVIGDEYPCTEIKNADRIILWQGDITRLRADAIVNAANAQMMGCFVPCHGCIDNAIHSAAGIQLRNECAQIMEEQGHEEPAGKAKITGGYNLPAAHIIHTVGPIVGGKVTDRQIEQLKSCYKSCLKLAERHNLKSIAFCCISTGEFHFPNKLAAETAIHVIDKYLSTSNVERAVINVYKNEDYNIYKKLFL